MADQDESTSPQLTNKTSKPAGIIPKNAQTWLMLGVAALIMGVILFSGSSQPKSKAKPELPSRPYASDANQRKIEEYKREVDEDTRRLELQKERARAQAALAAAAGQNSDLNGDPGQSGYASGQASPAGYSSRYGSQQQSPEEMQRQAIENEKRKREYASLFASNVVLSFRKEQSGQGEKSAARTVPSTQDSSLDQTQNPVLTQLEERERALQERTAQAQQQADAAYGAALAAYSQQAKDNGILPDVALRQVGGGGYGYPPSQATAAPMNPNAMEEKHELAEKRAKQADDPQLQQAQGKKYHLFEGSVIEAVLTNRLDGAFAGPVNVMVTTNVYSHDHDHLLIPQGSRLLGEAQKVNAFGQNRLAVAFHRLIMPDGYSLSLDQFQGLNQIGETGLKDRVNHHYVQIFGTAIAIGLVAGIAQANTTYGYNGTGTDEMRQGFAQSLSGTSLQILNRFLNILPTVTIREGNRIKILLTDDLFLPAYDNHTIPSNL
jgi:type IV secretion system protein TrbI